MIQLEKISTKAPESADKAVTKEQTKELLKTLSELQNLLFANGKHAVLAVFQGMDASGKDGAISNVFGAINPQGFSVASFKVPTEEERAHDFLWRVHPHAPARGRISVFNRSHYEDVLVTRVHGWCDDETAEKRFRAINNFESLLTEHNNTLIFKFYLHVSAKEQQERFEERRKDPTKHWKYNPKDLEEAALRDKYIKVYEEAFERCNQPAWIIVPADQNWYKEFVVAKTLVDSLSSLNMTYPPSAADPV